MIYGNRRKYQSLVDFPGHHIFPNSREDTEYNEICSKEIDVTARRFVIKYLTITVAAFLAVAGPTYDYTTNGIKTSTTELRIPFTEPGSNAEFIINVILQFNIYLHGATVYIGLEIMVSIFENVMMLTPQLVRFELKKLSIKQENKELSDQQVSACFKNILKQVLDFQM